jgi:drug/metabolite transporter (DMT)-like permease
VGSADFLVDTHPVIIALLAPWVLREPTRLSTWIGIVLTMVGGAVIAAGDFEIGGRPFVGDVMALGAAAAFAGYLVIGRRARQGLSTASYAGLVYGIAGLLLLPAAAFSAPSLAPTSPRDPLVWLCLVLIPTLGGHTVFNWALRHVEASIVGVSILGEPVLATVLALFVLGEQPRPNAVVGGMIVLAGLFIALRSGSDARENAPENRSS